MEEAVISGEEAFQTALAAIEGKAKEIAKMAHDEIENMQALADSKNWKSEGDLDGADFYTMEEGGPVPTRKLVMAAPYSVEKIMGHASDPTYRLSVAPEIIESVEVLIKVLPRTYVIRTMNKGGLIVDKRDAVTVLHAFLSDDGTGYIVEKSVDVPEGPIFEGYVRAETFASFILEPIDDENTKVTRLASLDPKGHIPDVIKRKIGKENMIKRFLDVMPK